MRSFFAEGQVKVGDETLHLVCDFFTIDVAEGVVGQGWDDILPQMVKPRAGLAIKMLWSLLRKKHEGITLDEAAGIYHSDEAAAVGVVMGDVIRRACNLERAKDENPPKRRGRSRTTAENG